MHAAPHTAHAKRVVAGWGERCPATLMRLSEAVMVAKVAKVLR
jgi:TusA-related sulfurtransferase